MKHPLAILPAWPREKPARFVNLRAQGGFLVSARQAGGSVEEVTIVSTVGGKLRMVSPWPAVAVRRGKAGRPQSLKPDRIGVVELDTRAGERLVFRRAL